MKKVYALVLICTCLPLAPASAWACGAHMYFNPEEFGFFGGAVARMAGLTPPEPVFELDHPSMAKSVMGEQSEIVVTYSRPFFSKNVRMEVKGSRNVELDTDAIPLNARSGTITIPYTLIGAGLDSITLTVEGEHKGKIVRQSGRIYVRAARKAPEQDLQVSER